MEIGILGGGVSGLATAYRIEQEARRQGREVTVRLFEAAPRLGGKIDTRWRDGFVIEGGVNGWLDSKPTTDQLSGELGLDADRLVSNAAARRRFVWRAGRLQQLPADPLSFLGSGLLSWRGKLRLLAEPWAEPPRDDDETLAQFARRRLGGEALEVLLDPMVSGVFAGDPEQMSLKSAFPRIAELEQQHGGLFKGMLKTQRERRRGRAANRPAGGPAGPGGQLVSFRAGMGQLVEALAAALTTAAQCNRVAKSVTAKGGGYEIVFADDHCVQVERLVVATPAWAAGPILSDLDPDLAREVALIPYAALSVVALAWPSQQVPASEVDGFGFLIPHREQRKILGTLWDSSVFLGRAPDGYVLTRTMVGGMRQRDLALRPPDEIVAMVRAELGEIMGVRTKPTLVEVIPHEQAIPQYVPGHADRLGRVAGRLSAHPGLFLTGNAYRGVALNDCTLNASLLAPQVLG